MKRIRIYGSVDGDAFDYVMEFDMLTVDDIHDLIQQGTDSQTWIHLEDTRGQHLCINFAKASFVEIRAASFE